jgi:hypothetical protein
MVKHLKRLGLILEKLAALAIGIFVGAALAVAILARKLSVWLDSLEMLPWIMRGQPLGPNEADDTWLLRMEWSIALTVATEIAVVGCLVWQILAWRRKTNGRAALLLGCVLALGTAALLVGNDLGIGSRLLTIALLGCAGAIAGGVVFVCDHAVHRRLSGWLG